MTERKKRVIIGKLGLDSHDNGIRIVARWLRDGGYEVIYAGLYNTTERMVEMAVQEGADAIGVSFLGGEHLHYADELVRTLKQKDMADVKVIMGGVIPPEDVDRLKRIGIDAIFTPGAMRKAILADIEGVFH